MRWTDKEHKQGFRDAEFETYNGRAMVGRIGEDGHGYLTAEHVCQDCGLTSSLQVFLRDFTAFCGEGHCTQLTREVVEAMHADAIKHAKDDGYLLAF